MNYFANSKTGSNLFVNIVSERLRTIGHYAIFTSEPNKKVPQGVFYHNKTSGKVISESTRVELEAMKEIDPDFFEVVMNKLGQYELYRFNAETDRRNKINNHTPSEVLYAIYDADDYGRSVGDPRGFVTITTTGDTRADEVTAIKAQLLKEGNGETAIGFFKGEITTKQRIQEKVESLKARIDVWNSPI